MKLRRAARIAAMMIAPPLTLCAQTAPLEQAQALVDSGKLTEAESAVRVYLKDHASSGDAHAMLGYVLFKENNPKPSLAEYTEAAHYRKPTATDLEVIGCDYFLLEDYTASDKWLSESLSLNRQNPLALYFLGRARYNEKLFDQAILLFLETLRLNPRDPKAEEYLGLSYEHLGKLAQAEEAYKVAAASDTDAGPAVDLGALLNGNGRAAEAVPYLEKAVRLAPQDAKAHRELGKAYMLTQQTENARGELEKAVELDAQNAPTHFLLAQVYRRLGMSERATAERARYNELTGSHSVSDDPLAQARTLIGTGNLAEAAQAIHRYLAANPNSADAHFLLGYILFKQRDAKASLAEYTEGAKYRTPSAYDLETVGADYVLLHDYVDADKWFSRAVEWNPNNFQSLYYLARTKYKENRFDEAVDLFTRCLKLQPKSVKVEDNLGLSYQGLGRMDDAMAAFRAAISWQEAADKRDAGPYFDLGSLLVDSNRIEEAMPFLEQALQLAPEDMRMHRELGKAYLRLNQLEKAQTELEKSAELAPDNPPIHFMLSQVYRRRGMPDKAKTEAARYSELAKTHSVDE